MEPSNKDLSELVADVGSALGKKFMRSRRRVMSGAARELDLKPGTYLDALASRLEGHPELVAQFDELVGHQMILYCLNTRIGWAIVARASNEGKRDPRKIIVELITRAAAVPLLKPKARAKKRK